MRAPAGHKQCSESGCYGLAAFRSTTRPAWCDDHITELLRQAGLDPIEPFAGRKKQRLTRCLKCGCEAHYSLDYTLTTLGRDEATCRACYWRGWAGMQRSVLPGSGHGSTLQDVRELAQKNRYDYLGPLTDPSFKDDPHLVRCQHCGIQSAKRASDIGWGCDCRKSRRRTPVRQLAPDDLSPEMREIFERLPQPGTLFKDSGRGVVQWWDHQANTEKDWLTASVAATRSVHWICPDCGLRFTAKVRDMANRAGCPDCDARHAAEVHAKSKAETEWLRDKTVADFPKLLSAWADEDDPATVSMLSRGFNGYRFRCTNGHHPRVTPRLFMNRGCPSCLGQETRAQRELGSAVRTTPLFSPELLDQWHPTRNHGIDPMALPERSAKTVWWRDTSCGYEWEESVYSRETGRRLRCPKCETILDSLAYHHPDLGAEWSSSNPTSAWKIRPTTSLLPFIPTWVCRTDPTHRWRTPLASRHSGSGCPQCQPQGKSSIELTYHAAAVTAFGTADSGRRLRHPSFQRNTAWSADIAIDLPDGRCLVIEYDGSYWHAGKAELDRQKTLDLLEAELLVARLREAPLLPLGVQHPNYREWVVYAESPSPTETIRQVKTWALCHTSRP